MFTKKFRKLHIIYYILLLFSINKRAFSDPIFIKKSREFLVRGDFAGAISYLKTWENVRLIASDKAKLYKKEGDIYLYYLHNNNEAINSYSKALEFAQPFSEEYLKSFFGLAQAYARKGDINTARKILGNLKTLYKNRPEIASINYMLKEVEKLKVIRKKKIQKEKQKKSKTTFKTISSNPLVKVKLGVVDSMDMINKGKGRIEITVFLPGGISDTLHTLKGIDINQFPAGTTFVIKSTSGFLIFKRKTYRGSLILKYLGKRKIEVVNVLPLEDYLKGVLPWEINPGWPIEALKAQAVAARTYALYHILQQNEYDLESTVLSQVYMGASIENPKTNMAIKVTRGEILTYNGLPILAYFHSCDGGYREIPENVWGVSFPYFKRGIDPWCMKNPQRWHYTTTLSEITRKLKKAYPFIGKIREIDPIKKDQTVIYLLIKSQNGNIKVRVNNFRLIIGPSKIKSAIFEIKRRGEIYIFKGKGYGHGVGLSQWGAYYMAKSGKNYREILQFYYPGTRLRNISNIRLYFHEAMTR